VDIVLFLSILLFILFYGWWSGRKTKTESSYLLANRKTTLFPLVATLVMTEFNTSTLIGFSSVGATAGVWGVLLPLVFLFGLGFYALVVARKWKEFNGFSTAGFFTKVYGKSIGRTVSGLLLIAMLGFTATYIKSMTFLFQPIFIGSILEYEWLLSLLVTCLVLLLAIRGGLVSIIRIDVLGFLAVLVLIPLIYYFSSGLHSPSVSHILEAIPLQEGQKALPPEFILSLVILTMFTYISAPWYSQKIFSAESPKTAYTAVGISAILVFVLYAFPVLAVANFSIHHEFNLKILSAQHTIPAIVNHFFPEGWKGFAYAIFLVIGGTTLAGVWSAMNTMIIGDFIKQEKYASKGIGRSMIIMTTLALLSWLLSNTVVDRILDKLILANIPVFSISFALLAGFYWKKVTKFGAVLSMILGVVWGIFSYLYWGEAGGYTTYWVFGGLPIIFGSGILGSLMTRNERN
jgi:solute:Na+ symporter, SSS family